MVTGRDYGYDWPEPGEGPVTGKVETAPYQESEEGPIKGSGEYPIHGTEKETDEQFLIRMSERNRPAWKRMTISPSEEEREKERKAVQTVYKGGKAVVKGAYRAGKWLVTPQGTGRGGRGKGSTPAGQISRAFSPNLSREERIALYFGKASPATTGTTVATNPFTQLQAKMASGPNTAGMMHRADLSLLRRAGAPPYVQAAYAEIVANNDVDSLRNIKDDMQRLGYSSEDTRVAISILSRLGLIERVGAQGGSPVYAVKDGY